MVRSDTNLESTDEEEEEIVAADDSSNSDDSKSSSNDLMEEYAQLQKDANTYRQASLCEIERHNKEIEAIAVWEGKQKELEYKRNLYQEYLNLKKTMPEKRIAKIFPDMAQFFGDDDDDST